MWSAIFSSLSHCNTVTDVIDDGMIVVKVDVLSELILDVVVDILPVTAPAITLEFVVEIAYTGDVSAGMFVVLIIDVVTGIDVDMLADENVNGLVAVMTPLDPTLLAPWEKSMPVC